MVEMHPEESLGHFGRGVIYVEMGDMESAYAAWEQSGQESLTLWAARGLAYEKMGQSELAAADYDRVSRESASTDDLGQFIGLITSGGYAVVPPYFYVLECVTNAVQGKVEDAFERCNKALEADPAYANALWKRGQLYAAQGDWEAALADYTGAVEADSSWPWYYYLRAGALAELGRTAEAQADLARALELNPVDELRQRIESFELGE
jgi:tetratricopeptide (TPR) repeat protein